MNYKKVKDLSGSLDNNELRLRLWANDSTITRIRISAGDLANIISNNPTSLSGIMATEDYYEGKPCMFVYYDGVAVIKKTKSMETFYFDDDSKNKFHRIITMALLQTFASNIQL